MSDKERPKLRLVTDDLEDVFEEVDDDLYAGEEPAPKAKPPRLPRSKKEFAMVPLRWLTNRRMDDVFPARTRLYLYLQYRSRRGMQEVKLTNKEVGKLGLTKQNKMRDLRWLETRSLLTVASAGSETVRVSVARQRDLPE
jgi:hypothetical protein